MKRNDYLILISLTALAMAGRLLPHFPDATPLTAVTLGGALYLRSRANVFVPLLAVLLSDIFLGLYNWPVLASVYGSWLLIGVVSLWVRSRPSAFTIAGLTLASSTLFFLITNTAVWAFTPWYQKDIGGLLTCLLAGVPFWRNMLLGDLLYTPAVLGAFAALRAPLATHHTAYARSI